MKTMRCCIPNCPSNATNQDHVAFYGIKPLWHRPIIEHIVKPVNQQSWIPKNPKLRSNVICGKHYRLCGIKDLDQNIAYFFPRLKFSVSSYSRKPVNYNAVYYGDEMTVDHEEVFPPVKKENVVNLKRLKKIATPKVITKHIDHNYAISLEYVRFLKHEYETCIEEQENASKQAQVQLETYKAEIQRLKDINHDLLKTQLNQSSVAFPVQFIPENEQLLKFYTGFAKRGNFDTFVDMLRPKYLELRKRESGEMRKQHLGMVPQLVLVLSRLRLGLMHNDLAYRFNISLTTVLKIWMFWVKLLTEVLVTKCIFSYDKSSHKVIVECYETFFETSKENKTKAEKTYGRARALIEFSSVGVIINASDLYPSYVTNEQIIRTWNEAKQQSEKQNDGESKKDAKKPVCPADLQTHVQKILGFVKGFKILKGTFPNSVTGVKQLNIFWKICCFLVNYTCPEFMEFTREIT